MVIGRILFIGALISSGSKKFTKCPFHVYCMTIEILHAQRWSLISSPEFLFSLSSEKISTKQIKSSHLQNSLKKKPYIDIAHYQLPLCMFRSWTSMSITWCAFGNMYYLHKCIFVKTCLYWKHNSHKPKENKLCFSSQFRCFYEKFQTLVQQDHFPNRKISYRVLQSMEKSGTRKKHNAIQWIII